MSKPRLRYRCVSIEKEGVSMRVQTVEGEQLSPETIAALLGLGKAVTKMMARGELPATKRLKKGPPK